MKKLVAGNYETRFIGDSELKLNVKVLSRTAKRLTFKVNGETKKAGISVFEEQEYFYPLGRYSMASIIRAEHLIQ